jgi:hypothetical protein
MAMQIEITGAELIQAKRAVVVLSEMAKVAIVVGKTELPLEMKRDVLVLIKILRKLENIAK